MATVFASGNDQLITDQTSLANLGHNVAGQVWLSWVTLWLRETYFYVVKVGIT